MLFCHLMIFFKTNFLKNSFRNTIRVSSSLDPNQARHFVVPDLGPNCLQRLSADNTWRWRVNSPIKGTVSAYRRPLIGVHALNRSKTVIGSIPVHCRDYFHTQNWSWLNEETTILLDNIVFSSLSQLQWVPYQNKDKLSHNLSLRKVNWSEPV